MSVAVSLSLLLAHGLCLTISVDGGDGAGDDAADSDDTEAGDSTLSVLDVVFFRLFLRSHHSLKRILYIFGLPQPISSRLILYRRMAAESRLRCEERVLLFHDSCHIFQRLALPNV